MNVDPTAEIPRAVTALNSTSGTSSVVSASIPASSSTWVGGWASASSTTTPQIGKIGSATPATSGVHGPAATTTASAWCVSSPTRTPVARDVRGRADAHVGAGLAGAGGPGVRGRRGRDRAAGVQAVGDEAVGERRLRGAQRGALEVLAPRRGCEGRVAHEQQPGRLGRQLEAAAERPRSA